MKLCTIDGCDRPLRARGWCATHWSRWRQHGDPLGGQHHDGAPLRFVEAVARGEVSADDRGCIIWPFSVSSNGYPQVKDPLLGPSLAGASVLTRAVGPKPTPDHQAGHATHDVCGSKLCVAPAHLSWQSRREQALHQRLDGTARRVDITDSLVTEAVRRVHAGESRASVARDIGVSPTAVCTWVRGTFRRDASEQVAS